MVSPPGVVLIVLPTDLSKSRFPGVCPSVLKLPPIQGDSQATIHPVVLADLLRTGSTLLVGCPTERPEETWARAMSHDDIGFSSPMAPARYGSLTVGFEDKEAIGLTLSIHSAVPAPLVNPLIFSLHQQLPTIPVYYQRGGLVIDQIQPRQSANNPYSG